MNASLGALREDHAVAVVVIEKLQALGNPRVETGLHVSRHFTYDVFATL